MMLEENDDRWDHSGGCHASLSSVPVKALMFPASRPPPLGQRLVMRHLALCDTWLDRPGSSPVSVAVLAPNRGGGEWAKRYEEQEDPLMVSEP
jgi:hypothetical protein